jgi:drug/metabolite transporter (DMT)-like permease
MIVAGFIAIYLLWGSTYLGIKFAVETLPPLLMAGTRFILAGLILFLIQRARGVPMPDLGGWKRGAITGAFLLLGGNGLVTWGQTTVPSGRAALLVATTPMWMVLLGWLLFKSERPTLRIWLGMAIGFFGATLLVKPGPVHEVGSIAGTIAVLLAPICWSIGSLESRRNSPVPDVLMSSALQMLTGGSLMLLLGTARGEWAHFAEYEPSTKSILAFLYLTIFGGLVGFTTYAWLLRVASPTAVSTYAYVNPLVAVMLGCAIAGEKLDANALSAAVLILGAVVLITLPKSKEPTDENAGQTSGLWRGLLERLAPLQAMVRR